MAGITLASAEATLAAYQAAELAVLNSQEYRISVGGNMRVMRRADLQQIRDGITYWNNQVRDLTNRATRGRSRTVIPGW